MLTIKKRLIQPMTALYVATGITAFTVTLGGLLIFRPDFTPNQSAAFESTRQESPLEVRTASTTTSPSNANSDTSATQSDNVAMQTPPLQLTAPSRETPSTPQQQTTAPEAEPTQTSAPTESTTSTSPSPEPTQTESSEQDQQESEQPSLLDGVVNVLDAVL